MTNREKLAAELDRTFSQQSVHDIIDKLMCAGIPAAPINSVKEAIENPQVIARDMITEMDSSYGKIKMLGTPFKMSRTPGKLRKAPPELGEDSDEILRLTGYGEGEIVSLKKRGIVNSKTVTDTELK